MTISNLTLNTGAFIPQLGLGTWGVEAPDELAGLVDTGLALGYRHFDCAAMYLNEVQCGEVLAKHLGQGIQRHELFITSKLANNAHATQRVRPAIVKTLQDLKLDYLDLYLLHWPMATFDHGLEAYDPKELKVSYIETYQAMEALQKEGLTKAIGLCNLNTQQLARLSRECEIKPAVIQMEINPYLTQRKFVDYCQSNDILVTAFSPLGAPHRPWRKEESPVLLEDKTVAKIAQKHHKSSAQVLIRFAVQRGLSVLTRSVRPDRLQEGIEVFDFELDSTDMEQLFALNRNFRAMGYGSALDHPDHPFKEGIDDDPI